MSDECARAERAAWHRALDPVQMKRRIERVRELGAQTHEYRYERQVYNTQLRWVEYLRQEGFIK